MKKLFLYMSLVVFSQCVMAQFSSAMEVVWKEKTSEQDKVGVGAGLHLVNPLIRVTPEQYAHENNPRVLVLGGGMF